MEFESYKYNVIESAKNAFDDVMKNQSLLERFISE